MKCPRLTRLTRGLCLALCVLLLPGGGPAAAEEEPRFEITPFSGYRFMGGSLTDNVTGRSCQLDDAGSYGLMLGYRFDRNSWVELFYSRLGTDLKADGFFTGAVLFPVAVHLYQLGSAYEYGEGKVRPFVAASVGAAVLNPDAAGLSSETRFAMTVGGGVKLFPVPRVGLRLEARAIPVFISMGGDLFCSGGCVARITGDVLWQLEASAGVVLAF